MRSSGRLDALTVRIVVARGGNALIRPGDAADAATQRANVGVAVEALAALAAHHQLAVTHGNGPQVGLLALQGDAFPQVALFPLADALLLLTDVRAVEAGWGTPRARPLAAVNTAELRALRFAEGSMAPKVEAACRFAELTGKPAGDRRPGRRAGHPAPGARHLDHGGSARAHDGAHDP
jgi:carbamate kinase